MGRTSERHMAPKKKVQEDKPFLGRPGNHVKMESSACQMLANRPLSISCAAWRSPLRTFLFAPSTPRCHVSLTQMLASTGSATCSSQRAKYQHTSLSPTLLG